MRRILTACVRVGSLAFYQGMQFIGGREGGVQVESHALAQQNVNISRKCTHPCPIPFKIAAAAVATRLPCFLA